MDRSRIAFAVLAGLSLVTLAVVSTALSSPWLRLALSLAAVVPGYAGAVVFLCAPSARRKAATQPRRFYALRNATDRFLEEVRRLNAVRVAVETGAKSPLEARPEIREIEERMVRLVEEMRQVAGQVTPRSGFPPASGPLP